MTATQALAIGALSGFGTAALLLALWLEYKTRRRR